MREVFKNELDAIADELVSMARQVTAAIDSATTALETNDLPLAEQVISGDASVDAMQAELDQKSAQVLALQAPVAADLRVIISALKMSVAIERMGDLARHIAAQVRIRYPEPAVPAQFSEVFSQMGRAAHRIGEAMITLLDDPGTAAVPMIAAIDEELDTLHLRVFTIIGELAAGDITPSQIADVTLISRYFERFGDQAVNVSRRVEYLLTGNWEPALSQRPQQ
ncbi:phosphate signaling complex protein PhoU [Brevibacterium sp. 5221]|uniref:Phosphate-specific transport system accessory protein PhoU n=1 Tax=Brevibacterium rongguiense TaxID=2695267 RepID=A0A6N9H8Y6_9MICO|nr:phosphate signaling complex protein PhoU [Brevibacterium rongguiense]MYM20497.1 phosphate signaling complex protein PhoU [Brevibacterium rongguiense]